MLLRELYILNLTSRVVNLRKLENFKQKYLEILGIEGKSPANSPKRKILVVAQKVVKNLLQKIPYRDLFYLLIFSSCLQYFDQDCTLQT